jgi:DNA polymerase III delta subunit
LKFTELKKSLSCGAKPIYLFEGEDEFFKERGEAMLKEKFLTEPSFNFSTFEGDTLKESRINDLVKALCICPFASVKRIVKVSDFYPTENEYKNYLEKLFVNPPDTAILIIVNTAKPKGKTCKLKDKPSVTYVDCSHADEDTILRYIYTAFKKENINIDTSVCAKIMNYCLCDMTKIVRETEKLICYVKNGGTVTDIDVENVVYKDTEYKFYEMNNAIARKNYTLFMSILSDLIEKGEDEMSILNSLCSYYKTLYEISVSGKSDSVIAKEFKMNEYAVKKNREQAANLTKETVQKKYNEIFRAVCDIKSGILTMQGALKLVTAKILFE